MRMICPFHGQPANVRISQSASQVLTTFILSSESDELKTYLSSSAVPIS
jgi:hypothetical protein